MMGFGQTLPVGWMSDTGHAWNESRQTVPSADRHLLHRQRQQRSHPMCRRAVVATVSVPADYSLPFER